MTTPTVFFYGGLDQLADPTDVLALQQDITNLVDCQEIDDYIHADFLFAVNAPDVLYSKIVDMINGDRKGDNVRLVNFEK